MNRTKRKWTSIWYLEKSMPTQSALWTSKASTVRTLQSIFSADVTRFSHTILINGPGNLAMETSALC